MSDASAALIEAGEVPWKSVQEGLDEIIPPEYKI